MATRTISDAGGNWNSTSSWVEGAVPTSSDDVIATATSGNLTINAAAACKSINLSLYTATLTHDAFTLTIGNATSFGFDFSGTWTYSVAGDTSLIIFSTSNNLTNDIYFRDRTYGNIQFTSGNNGTTYRFMDNLVQRANTSTLTWSRGNLNFNNVTITTGKFVDNASSYTRTLNMGSCTLNLSTTSGNAIYMYSNNLTLNCGTSTINVTGGAHFGTGGRTYYDVNITALGTNLIGYATFNNLTVIGAENNHSVLSCSLGNPTITGTLTLQGYSSIYRLLVCSSTPGSLMTITAATIVASNLDLRDIEGAGTANWNLSSINGGSGDCGGNSGITFTPSQTLYWFRNSLATQANWDDVGNWFQGSGGTGGIGRIPLPQDDVIFDANSFNSTYKAVYVNMPRAGKNVDFSGVNVAGTIGSAVSFSIYGSFTAPTVLTGNLFGNAFTLEGRGNYKIKSNGRTFAQSVTVSSPSGTYTLDDDFQIIPGNGRTLAVSYGTFDANNFNVTADAFSSTGTGVRTVKMGSGLWTLHRNVSGDAWNLSGSNLIFEPSTSKILIRNTTTGVTQTFKGGGYAYNDIEFEAGAAIVVFEGNNSFNNIYLPTSKKVKFTKSTITTIRGDLKHVGYEVIEPTEVIINGSFSTDTNWTKVTGCTISGGELVLSGVATGAYIYENVGTESGAFEITYTISEYTGGAIACIGGSSASDESTGTYRNSVGTYTEVIPVSINSTIGLKTSGVTSLKVDNYSAKRITDMIAFTTADGLGQFTLFKEKGIISCDYISMKNCKTAGDSIWFAGANSIDNGNNEGWRFTHDRYRYRACK